MEKKKDTTTNITRMNILTPAWILKCLDLRWVYCTFQNLASILPSLKSQSFICRCSLCVFVFRFWISFVSNLSILNKNYFPSVFEGIKSMAFAAFLSSTMKHVLSFLFGFTALWFNFRNLISHSVIVSLVSYILIYALKYSAFYISVGLLTYLTSW